jgi:hypothetical protein
MEGWLHGRYCVLNQHKREVVMSAVLVAGLAVLVVGVFMWAISRPLAQWAGRSHPFLEPGPAQQDFARRKLPGIRVVATLWLLFGAGLIIYSLLTGK